VKAAHILDREQITRFDMHFSPVFVRILRHAVSLHCAHRLAQAPPAGIKSEPGDDARLVEASATIKAAVRYGQ